MTPHIVIVGADKGGVGKTMLSRLLLAYLGRLSTIDHRAFDTQIPNGILKRFYPGKVEVVDISKSDDQVRIFDTIKPNQVTVIDLAAGGLEQLLRLVGDLGFLEDVNAGRLKITVLHVIGSTQASFDEIKSVAALVKGSKHYLVTNHINGASFLGLSAELKAAAAGVLNIQKLDETVVELVDLAGVPFADFQANENNSRTYRGYLSHWLGKCFAEFDALRIIEI